MINDFQGRIEHLIVILTGKLQGGKENLSSSLTLEDNYSVTCITGNCQCYCQCFVGYK